MSLESVDSAVDCPTCTTRNAASQDPATPPRCEACGSVLPWIVEATNVTVDTELQPAPFILDLEHAKAFAAPLPAAIGVDADGGITISEAVYEPNELERARRRPFPVLFCFWGSNEPTSYGAVQVASAIGCEFPGRLKVVTFDRDRYGPARNQRWVPRIQLRSGSRSVQGLVRAPPPGAQHRAWPGAHRARNHEGRSTASGSETCT